MSTLIPVEGKLQDIKPKDGKEFSLEELQKAVGGYIELACRTHDGRILFVNEEGKLLHLLPNTRATLIYRTYIRTHDIIVGNAILVDKEHTS